MMGVFVQVNEDSRYAKLWPLGYVIQENGCWDWVGHKNKGGYGTWQIRPGKLGYAHRRMFEMHRMPIPDGKELDHLCRNRGCVNPDHLEPVTMRENILRGVSGAAENARKTHCPKGHPYDAKNTYHTKAGGRQCRECTRRRWMARYHKAQAAKRKEEPK